MSDNRMYFEYKDSFQPRRLLFVRNGKRHVVLKGHTGLFHFSSSYDYFTITCSKGIYMFNEKNLTYKFNSVKELDVVVQELLANNWKKVR